MNMNTLALELIERAEREAPSCEACGAPTNTVACGDRIWVECATLGQPKPLLRKLLTLDFGHTRRFVTDLSIGLAGA